MICCLKKIFCRIRCVKYYIVIFVFFSEFGEIIIIFIFLEFMMKKFKIELCKLLLVGLSEK